MILFRLALLAGALRALGIIDSLGGQKADCLPSRALLSGGTGQKVLPAKEFSRHAP